MDLKQRSKLTKNGEARIENCHTFHLVNGYRLIFVRNNGCLIFLFLGAHDDADSWIKNNSGIRPDVCQGEIVANSKMHPQAEDQVLKEDQDWLHEYDRPLHEFIDQKTLREIFPGISAQPRGSTQCQ